MNELTAFDLIVASPFYLLAGLVWRYLWRRRRSSRAGMALLAAIPVLAMVPFADELWISWQFRQACLDAGIKVHRKVEAEGVLIATGSRGQYKESRSKPKRIYNDAKKLADWDAVGLRFKEELLGDGSAWHVERLPDGVYGWMVPKPTARYLYRYADPRQWVPVAMRTLRYETQVVDFETGEILGRQVLNKRYPGLVRQLWVQFVGLGEQICYRPLDDPQNGIGFGLLYRYVLIPKKAP